MKLSVYNEPGYRNVAGQGWRITMDGRALERVVRVDTCTGVAWVHDTGKNGELRIDRARSELVERRVFGPMRAEPMPT